MSETSAQYNLCDAPLLWPSNLGPRLSPSPLTCEERTCDWGYGPSGLHLSSTQVVLVFWIPAFSNFLWSIQHSLLVFLCVCLPCSCMRNSLIAMAIWERSRRLCCMVGLRRSSCLSLRRSSSIAWRMTACVWKSDANIRNSFLAQLCHKLKSFFQGFLQRTLGLYIHKWLILILICPWRWWWVGRRWWWVGRWAFSHAANPS